MTPNMLRKLIIIAGATATLAAASVAVPTGASAGWHGGHGHGHHHHWRGWRGPAYGLYAPVYYGSSCYVVKKRVYTDYGPRIRRVTVCG
jgi:hypothetical protein